MNNSKSIDTSNYKLLNKIVSFFGYFCLAIFFILVFVIEDTSTLVLYLSLAGAYIASIFLIYNDYKYGMTDKIIERFLGALIVVLITVFYLWYI